MHTRAHRSRPLALLACAGLLLSGCATFDDTAAGQTYQPAPKLTPQAGPQPELPGADNVPGSGAPAPKSSQQQIPPPNGCTDYDPAVIGTCMDTVDAVAALPGDANNPSALAGERRSGTIYQVAPKAAKQKFATIEVNAAGDGGLTGLSVSPTYAEDQLVFAYVTTGSDNRVVRLAKGQAPKPVLTGIPKGASGNRGTLSTDGKGALLVATGDAGNATAAADPNSLAGKVLRIDTSGKPAKGNPNPASAMLASGLHNPGGLCKAADGSRLWVTDRGPDKDLLYRVAPGKPLTAPAWTWPERPGVAGCGDWANQLTVATSKAGNLQSLPIAQDGAISGKPTVSMDGKSGINYGKLGGMDMISADLAVAGTVNKSGGKPVSSDDRAVLIVRPQGGANNGKD